ncbi:MAG: LacI family DNA-binding transcriptional regulator [Clostridium sp.]
MKKNVTAKDVAKMCGVSQATVSYIVNDSTNQKISEETRQKVLNAIEELHYFPNVSARNMRNRNCASVGIVCAKDYSRQAFLDSLVGISRYFDKINYTITIFNAEDFSEDSDTPQYVKSYFSKIIDGLIYISNDNHNRFIEPAVKHGIPYVVICMDGVFSKNSPVPHAFDDVLTECAIFCKEHALDQIRYFSIDNKGLFVNHKYPVFKKALETVYPECHIQHVVCHVENREIKHLVPILEDYVAHNSFDIAFSQNYDIGLIIQKELLKKDFLIPQKTKNIFLNYVNFYELTYPSITGIMIPYGEMGTYAAKLIMAIIDGKEESFCYENFKCRLIHRQSTEF